MPVKTIASPVLLFTNNVYVNNVVCKVSFLFFLSVFKYVGKRIGFAMDVPVSKLLHKINYSLMMNPYAIVVKNAG